MVTANGLWSNDENRSSMKALRDLSQAADQKLGGEYLSSVSMLLNGFCCRCLKCLAII